MELKDLVEYCKDRNIKLIGLDLKEFGFSNRQLKIIRGNIKPSKKDKEDFRKLAKKREEHQVEEIKRNYKEKPINDFYRKLAFKKKIYDSKGIQQSINSRTSR